MDYTKQIDEAIKGTAQKVEIGKVTVLTGKNGSGKSMLRKILASYIADKLGKDDIKGVVSGVSMESRTQRKFDFGALNSMGIDDPTNPTSSETLHNIDSLVRSVSEKQPRYLVIDEPEIGMGEEMVAALVIKLNDMFNPLPIGCNGVLLITHNRYIVENVKGEFLNMEGQTREEWLNRKIIPVDIEKFKEESLELYRAINNYKKDKTNE